MLMLRTKQRKFAFASDMLFFSEKKLLRDEQNFCNAHAIADAVLIMTFRIMTFMIKHSKNIYDI